MPIVLCRSNRTEDLVERLCKALEKGAPGDPFEPVAVVVGSRGMERWLRHEIATERGVTGRLAFPFPRQAFDGAAAWLLDGAPDSGTTFWEAPTGEVRGWSPDALAFRTLRLLRDHLGDAAFERVRRYLENRTQGAVGTRELAFAREVADVLDRMLHDRPDQALSWADSPSAAPDEHRWLALLLRELGAATDEQSPARLHMRLLTSKLTRTEASLYLFGLSTLGPGDRTRLGCLARAMNVYLFLLAPSQVWWADVRSKHEQSRAMATATDARSQAQLEAELLGENPLLSVLGMPSRDIQVWLEDLEGGYQEEESVVPDVALPEPGSLLTRLQAWINRAGGLAGETGWPADDTVSLHSSYGPLRQCEVLRDELLAMFAADERLEPRHVCVMTPDIETYAPLVSAVFARRGLAALPEGQEGRLPSIPTTISDLGLRRTNPVAEVLLSLLELTGERLTASRLLDFMSLEALRQRVGLSADDLSDLRTLVLESGMCWGIDAPDRARFDQPERDQNTVRFGLERLALGVLMPDEGADKGETVGSADPGLGPAAPLPVESRERVARVGKLALVVRHVARVRDRCATPRTMAAWRELLRESLDALTETTAKGAWLRAEVDELLDDLVQSAEAMGDLRVEREALLRWLRDRFEIPQRGDRPITGAVTVCSLEPMRSVPFEVVALVGMDDGAFPRGSQPRAWDPFSEVKGGERDRRAVDRHLLLEALLSARKRLLVLWSGRDLLTGEELPAAVPVEELIEILGRLTGATRGQLVRQSALQPWSPRNFDPAAPCSFDARMAEAARRTLRIARGQEPPAPRGLATGRLDPLPPEREPPGSITLDDLARGLNKPHKMLLRDRLGLRLESHEEQLPDREPIELDGLELWRLRDRILPAALEEDSLDETWVRRFRDRLAGEGVLPLQAGGERILTGALSVARGVADNLEAVGGELVSETLNVNVVLGGAVGLELSGNVSRHREKNGRLLLEWPTAGNPSNWLRLQAWLHVLAAAANELPVAGARLVGAASPPAKAKVAGELLAWSGTAPDARQQLEDLASVWRRARSEPVELFPTVSPKVADLLAKDGDLSDAGVRRRAESEIRAAWEGGYMKPGDRQDTWIQPCFQDYDPTLRLFDESEGALVDLARRVWLPLKRAAYACESLAAEWAREGASK